MIRWGIIGCGDVTEIKSGPAFQLVPDSSLTLVMRRDAERCASYAARHGVPGWTTDADALIHSPDVDAVYVATPPSSHKDYALRVMEAGKPVYIEKPLALNGAECGELLDAARRTGARAFVAYYRRRLPYFLKIKSLLDEGVIGEVRTVRIVHSAKPSGGASPDGWRVNKAMSGGGLLLDVGSHTLDILDYLLGPVASVRAFTANQRGLYRVEDTISASLRFESGALASATWCFESAFAEEHNLIEGTKGRIHFATFDRIPLTLTLADGTQQRFDIDSPKHIQQPMIEHVVRCLHNHEKPVSTLESAARTSRVMEEICDAMG